MQPKRTIFSMTLGTMQSFDSTGLAHFRQTLPGEQHPGHHMPPHDISTSQHPRDSRPAPGGPTGGTASGALTRKCKIIRKPAKGRESEGTAHRAEGKQTLLYKYFKRKIFPTSNKLEIQETEKAFSLPKIIDWLMEASHNLHLWKDTFYTALTLAINFYRKERNQLHSHRTMQLQVAAMLSLAAKLESNKINFAEVISRVCALSRSDIVQQQIGLMKMLCFKIPVVSPMTCLVEVCQKWECFLKENETLVQLQPQLQPVSLHFGSSDRLSEWSYVGRANFNHLCTIFDIIALRLHKKYSYQSESDLLRLTSQSLFMLVNCKIRQYFPSKTSHRTPLLHIYECFLTRKLAHTGESFTEWLAELIGNEEKLALVERVYQHLEAQKKEDIKEDHLMHANTTTCQDLDATCIGGLGQHYYKYVLN